MCLINTRLPFRVQVCLHVVLEMLSKIILKITSVVAQEYFYLKKFSKLTQSL